MTQSRLRTALAGRGFMLLPVGAFAVHQLRYEIAYGPRANAELAATGHGYLDSLAPWLAVLLAIAFGTFLMRLARAAAGRHALRPHRAFGALWLVASAFLLGAYSVQEWLEGMFAAGHPGGFEGIYGHGGYWAVPLSLAIGLAVAALLRFAAAAIEAVLPPAHRLLAAPAVAIRPLEAAFDRFAPHVGAGRGPPGLSAA